MARIGRASLAGGRRRDERRRRHERGQRRPTRPSDARRALRTVWPLAAAASVVGAVKPGRMIRLAHAFEQDLGWDDAPPEPFTTGEGAR